MTALNLPHKLHKALLTPQFLKLEENSDYLKRLPLSVKQNQAQGGLVTGRTGPVGQAFLEPALFRGLWGPLVSFQEDNRLCPAFAWCASGAQTDRAADIPTMQRKRWPHMSTFRFSTGGWGWRGGGGRGGMRNKYLACPNLYAPPPSLNTTFIP